MKAPTHTTQLSTAMGSRSTHEERSLSVFLLLVAAADDGEDDDGPGN